MTETPLNTSYQERVKRSFKRGLKTYHQASVVQAEIAHDLVKMLQEHGAPAGFEAGFEFGCGTGHLTKALLDHFEINTLVLNDLLAEGAETVCAIASDHGAQAQFLEGPIETLDLPEKMEIIASASTLQWVRGVDALAQRLSRALVPCGWLALSSFGRGHFKELQALGSQGFAPNYSDAEEWKSLLPETLELLGLEQKQIILEFRSLRDLLKHLQATGVNAQSGQSWTKSKFQRFEEEYRRHFERNGKLPLTYDAVLLVAKKRS